MGSLEEAIREHLDLRRRHGADPEEIAREERDALAPVDREGEQQGWGVSADGPIAGGADERGRGRVPFDEQRARITGGSSEERGGPADDAVSPAHSREPSFMEETAEIDMRTVLGELENAMSDEEAGGDAHVRRAVHAGRTTAVAAGGSRAAFDFEADEDLSRETPPPRARRIVRGAGEHGAGGYGE